MDAPSFAASEKTPGWQGAEIVTRKIRRPPTTSNLPHGTKLEWLEFSAGAAGAGDEGQTFSHEQLRAVDEKRKKLLTLARDTSASSTIFQLGELPRTVLPRLLKKPIIWLVVLSFIAGSVVSRLDLIGDQMSAETENLNNQSGETTVTFMVVFYVGYCYTRCNQQFDDVQLIMHSINDACLAARVSFEDALEVHRLWRYLNMLHAAAYCGLTEEFTESNFFIPLCNKFGLLHQGAIRAEEQASLQRINIDESGSRSCAMLEVWAFEVLKGEALRASHAGKGTLSPPIHARIMGEINSISISIKRLFAYRYQVLPYIYTHLVSLSCALFLFRSAFLVGLEFTPEASIPFGLILPAVGTAAQIIATFGLIEVGETILDPFGNDPEDFALLHFVEVTAVSSHEAINMEPCGKRVKEREAYYDPMELVAANKVVRSLINRYRWRKVLQQARTKAEFEARLKVAASDLIDEGLQPKLNHSTQHVHPVSTAQRCISRDKSTLDHVGKRDAPRNGDAPKYRQRRRPGPTSPRAVPKPMPQPRSHRLDSCASTSEHPGRKTSKSPAFSETSNGYMDA